MTSQQVRKLKSPQCRWPRWWDAFLFRPQPLQVQCSFMLYYEVVLCWCCLSCAVLCYAVLCCAYAASWVTISTSFNTVLCYFVLWSTVLYHPLLVQCCASWVTNFTSPYLAWHSIYLSKWKLIYPFLFRLVVLSDFRGLCGPCFWQNFVFESVKEMLNR